MSLHRPGVDQHLVQWATRGCLPVAQPPAIRIISRQEKRVQAPLNGIPEPVIQAMEASQC
jgi:hypothetical protein